MSNQMYLVVQTADIEIIAIESFKNKTSAMEHFEAIMEEDNLIEEDVDCRNELGGTLRIAGDDCACVQLIERKIKG